MIRTRIALIAAAIAGCGLIADALAQAQSYPDKPIKIIVPAAAGGPTDVPARLASQILQSEMERLRMKSWADINAMPASQTIDGATFFSTNADVAGKFSITRTITPDGTRPTEVVYITIQVTWTSYDKISHTRTFSSMYAKNGLYDYYYTLANS